jgi:spermidine/putrescine transport system ATP-binding protein
MSKGKVQQLGTPVEVYERPANRFVADFIGESNFFEGTIKSLSAQETCVFIPELQAEVIGIPVSAGLVNGEDVTVSVRPEKIHIAENGASQNSFSGRVKNSVYIGTDTHIFADVHGKTIKVFEQNRISRLDPRSYYIAGQDIHLVMRPENVLVLKKD